MKINSNLSVTGTIYEGNQSLSDKYLEKTATASNSDKVDNLYMLDQTYAYVDSLGIDIGCVNAIVKTGYTEAQIFALTGNKYGQLYLASDTNRYWRRNDTSTAAGSSHWRDDTEDALASLAFSNQLTTEDYVYIRIDLKNQYYAKLPKFFVIAQYDNTGGSTSIVGFCRQQNQFDITACSYNGNNLLGVYQESNNTDKYVFKLKKFSGTWGGQPDGIKISPRIYYNYASGSPTITFINKNSSDYNTVKAYSYVSVPTYGNRGTNINTTLLPISSNNYDIGSSSYFWKSIFGTTIYENGTALSSKYLGISSKAADSSKLNGQAASYYLDYTNFTNKPTIVNTVNSKSGAVTLSGSFSGNSVTSNGPSGTTTVASGSHTHYYNQTTGVTLTENDATATGRITYVKSISSTGASGTPTVRYLTFSAGTTPPSSASFSGTAATITPTLTGTKTFNTDAIKAITLSASETTTDGPQYLQNVTHTAASLTGTKTFNTDAIKSVTLSASETSTDGPTYVQSISGSAPSLGGTKTFVTGYSSFSGGSFSGSRATSGSGTSARRTLTLSHTAASLGSASTGTVSISGGSYTATTRYMKATGTAASTGTVGISGGSISKTTRYMKATGTAASTGTVGISGASYTPAGSVTLTEGTAPSLSSSQIAPVLQGNIPYLESYSVSGGTTTATTKYLSASPSNDSTATDTPSATVKVGSETHTHNTTATGSVTISATN